MTVFTLSDSWHASGKYRERNGKKKSKSIRWIPSLQLSLSFVSRHFYFLKLLRNALWLKIEPSIFTCEKSRGQPRRIIHIISCYSFLECVNMCIVCAQCPLDRPCVRFGSLEAFQCPNKQCRLDNDGGGSGGRGGSRHTFTCENVNRMRWHRRAWNIWVAAGPVLLEYIQSAKSTRSLFLPLFPCPDPKKPQHKLPIELLLSVLPLTKHLYVFASIYLISGRLKASYLDDVCADAHARDPCHTFLTK